MAGRCIIAALGLSAACVAQRCAINLNGDIQAAVDTFCVLGNATVRAVVVGAGAVVAVAGRVNASTLHLQANATLLASTTIIELFVSGNATLEAGSLIDGRGRGYGTAAAPGPGLTNANYKGAAHAGCGGGVGCGAFIVPGNNAGCAYGSVMAPVVPGSAGFTQGTPPSSTHCYHGGGAGLRLHVGDTLTLDGTIDMAAAGTRTCSNNSAGISSGSSGGSVFITAKRFLASKGTRSDPAAQRGVLPSLRWSMSFAARGTATSHLYCS